MVAGKTGMKPAVGTVELRKTAKANLSNKAGAVDAGKTTADAGKVDKYGAEVASVATAIPQDKPAQAGQLAFYQSKNVPPYGLDAMQLAAVDGCVADLKVVPGASREAVAEFYKGIANYLERFA